MTPDISTISSKYSIFHYQLNNKHKWDERKTTITTSTTVAIVQVIKLQCHRMKKGVNTSLKKRSRRRRFCCCCCFEDTYRGTMSGLIFVSWPKHWMLCSIVVNSLSIDESSSFSHISHENAGQNHHMSATANDNRHVRDQKIGMNENWRQNKLCCNR